MAGSPLVSQGAGRDATPPVVILPLTEKGTAAPGHVAEPTNVPAIVVGVGEPGAADPGVDLLLTEAEDPPWPWVTGTPDELFETVDGNWGAGLTLVHVLRGTWRLPVAAGVAVESMAYGMLQGSDAFQRWLADRDPALVHRPTARPVRVERRGDSIEITLDRPDVRNALDASTRCALTQALELVATDPSTRGHLRGAGPSFCGGGDLTEFGSASDPASAHAIRMIGGLAAAAAAAGPRLVAHLHGACIGAGIEIVAFAAHITASKDTYIRLPEVRMGLIPGAGGTVSLPRRIGRQRFAWLALTGVTLGADRALDWGLIDETTS